MTEISAATESGMASVRTIEVVTAEIVMIKSAAGQIALQIAIELGRRLVEAKEMLPYGEWGAWVRDKVEFSQVTATRYMRLYEEYAADQGSLFGAETDFSTLKNLSVSKALALLAVPPEEREAFAAEHQVEDLSSRQMVELMKRVKDAENAKESAETALAGERMEREKAELERDDLAGRVKELENRPVEVAVQEPDPAVMQKRVDDAVQAATGELRSEAKNLRSQLQEVKAKAEGFAKETEEAKQRLADAEAKNAGYQDLAAERDELSRQVGTLEKRLAASDGAVAAFGVLFGQCQRALNEAFDGLGKIEDQAVRAKLSTAVRELLEKNLARLNAVGDGA